MCLAMKSTAASIVAENSSSTLSTDVTLLVFANYQYQSLQDQNLLSFDCVKKVTKLLAC